MAKWNVTTLSTDTSINRSESTQGGISTQFDEYQMKIDLAKIVMGDKLEVILLRSFNIVPDYDESEVALDYLNNAEVFSLSSDYYTLFLIYDDMASGEAEGLYANKAKKYLQNFETEFEKIYTNRMALDTNQDGETDVYDVKKYYGRMRL